MRGLGLGTIGWDLDARSHAEMAHIPKGESMYLVEGVHMFDSKAP